MDFDFSYGEIRDRLEFFLESSSESTGFLAASLNAKIVKGSIWRMNVARVRRAGAKQETSTWMDGALIPKKMGDVTGLINLRQAMRENGYDEATMLKLCHKNWLRVLKNTLKN